MPNRNILAALAALLLAAALLLLTHPSTAVNYRKGIPVGGTPSEQKAALLRAGAKYLDKQEGTLLYRHRYAGLDCTLQHSDTHAGLLAATFPVRASWRALEKDYDRLWDALCKQYGEPTSQKYAFLHAGLVPDLDEYEELLEGRCDWRSLWMLPDGAIELSITANHGGECFVTIIWQTRTDNDTDTNEED